MSIFNEESYENAVLSLLENLGYEHIYGPDVERDYRVPFYEAQLAHSLMLVNPTKPAAAIDEAIRRIRDIDTGSLDLLRLSMKLFAGSGISTLVHSCRRTRSSWISSRMESRSLTCIKAKP